jgi:3-oxoacyl-[acyl-carrier protein] reductase
LIEYNDSYVSGLAEPKLKGQVALVTGAGRGLGRAYAHRLSALGARVAVLDLNLKSYADFPAEREAMKEDSTVAEIEARGGEAIGLEVDVTDSAAVNHAIDQIVQRWGRLDVAVCNAGGGTGTLAETTATLVSDAHLEAVVQRNLHGTVNTCRAAAVPMRAQRAGRLITISSVAGRRPEPTGGYAHYGAAKAAIIMYTRYLAQEVGPYGITANCVAPGLIRTGRVAPILDAMGQHRLETVALRRYGTPEDCAGVIEFLATDLGAYVTGATIAVDGGAA